MVFEEDGCRQEMAAKSIFLSLKLCFKLCILPLAKVGLYYLGITLDFLRCALGNDFTVV